MPEIVVFILVVLVTINDTLTIPFLTTGVAPSLESAEGNVVSLSLI